MRTGARPGERREAVLVADDDPGIRTLVGVLIEAASGASVLEAVDGVDALRLGLRLRPRIAVLDLNMPRLDGVEAALVLQRLLPSIRIALHSSDVLALRARARGLGLPLFDKLELVEMAEWAVAQLDRRETPSVMPLPARAERVALSCTNCGYGIVASDPPTECPMCHAATRWRPVVRHGVVAVERT